MVLTVNGIDMIPFIAKQGIKWTRNDVDGPNAGRSQNAYMIRDRIATKIRLDVTCRPLTSDEMQTVLKAIYPEYVTVIYTDPMDGKVVTRQMYSNNVPASFLLRRPNGTEWWSGITFPLIER